MRKEQVFIDLYNKIKSLNLKEGQKIRLYSKYKKKWIEIMVTYQRKTSNYSSPEKIKMYFLSNYTDLDGLSCLDKKGYYFSYLVEPTDMITKLVTLDLLLSQDYSLTF